MNAAVEPKILAGDKMPKRQHLPKEALGTLQYNP